MKHALLFLVGTIFIAGSFYLFLQKPVPEHLQPKNTIKIGDSVIQVEVAGTSEARNKGLSGRTSLENGTGMLFVFPQPDIYGFWMKDMNFALDIIWIDENLVVAGITKNVLPESYPTSVYPDRAVKYVLEVPAGYTDEMRIDPGEHVSLGF